MISNVLNFEDFNDNNLFWVFFINVSVKEGEL